jgi:hypothetical protein
VILAFGTHQELQLLGLLAAGATMLVLAGPLRIPYCSGSGPACPW